HDLAAAVLLLGPAFEHPDVPEACGDQKRPDLLLAVEVQPFPPAAVDLSARPVDERLLMREDMATLVDRQVAQVEAPGVVVGQLAPASSGHAPGPEYAPRPGSPPASSESRSLRAGAVALPAAAGSK